MSSAFRIGLLAIVGFQVAIYSLAQTAPYARTVVVSKTGSSPSANQADGAALLSVLATLSPPPSSGNRWLVKLEGGFYEVGSSPVVIPEFVNLAGAGRGVTVLRGSVGPALRDLAGLLRVSSNSVIRDLTVACRSIAIVQEQCQAISALNARPTLRNMKIQVGGTGSGRQWGIRAGDSLLRLENVVIDISAAEEFVAAYGVVLLGQSSLRMDQSKVMVRGSRNDNTAVLFKISGGFGVINDSLLEAVGGRATYGIRYLQDYSDKDLEMYNSRIRALNGSENYGIGHGSGHRNILIRGGSIVSGGDGILVSSSDVDVLNSEILAPGIAASAPVVNIGLSRLRGRVFGERTCSGIVLEDFSFRPDGCP